MSLRAAPKAGKLSPPKLLPWVKTFERPNSQDTWNMPCERMHATTGFPTVMKPSKTSVLQLYEIKRTRVPCDNLGGHFELYAPFIIKWGGKPQTRTPNMLLIGCSLKGVHEGSWQQGWRANLPTSDVQQKLQICAPWNIWKQDLRRQLKLQTVPLSFKNKTSKKIKEIKGSAKGSAEKPCMTFGHFAQTASKKTASQRRPLPTPAWAKTASQKATSQRAAWQSTAS